MVAMVETKPEQAYYVDGVGGVRCKGCNTPFFKVAPSPSGERPSGVIFLRHKSCGFYNIVDLASLTYT